MSLINKEVADFKCQAYQNDAFHEVTKADIMGKWSVFFFYPADFTFVCPTELKDLAEKSLRRLVARFTQYQLIATSFTRHGTMHQILLSTFSIQCLQIQIIVFAVTSKF